MFRLLYVLIDKKGEQDRRWNIFTCWCSVLWKDPGEDVRGAAAGMEGRVNECLFSED